MVARSRTGSHVLSSLAWHGILLLVWMILAAALRVHHLTLKPLWTDEFSTLVFGLGHSFTTIPLDQIISAETLLSPLKPTPDTTMVDAARHLLEESNHPPLYFMLTQVWTRFFQGEDGYVSIWGARSLSVLFGVLAVPAMYGLGWTAVRSPIVAHLAALLMAVSPFGVYLAQDARHYTLTVVWIILSLAGLVMVVRYSQDQKRVPFKVVLAWIGVNGLGMASHYFFALVLLAEAIALFSLIVIFKRQWGAAWHWVNQGRALMAIAGTIATSLVWLPFILAIRQGDDLTQWIYADSDSGWAFVQPIINTLASIVSMVVLLPVQNVEDEVAIASGIILLIVAIALTLFTDRGLKTAATHSENRLIIHILLWFMGGAIAIILLTSYAFGIELAHVFRYHFIYFPALLLLVAFGMAAYGQFSLLPQNLKLQNLKLNSFHPILPFLIILAIIGSLTVSSDFGYRKLHRPDRVVAEIAQRYEVPILVAISHQTHGQTGRLMALAWEMRRQSLAARGSFPDSDAPWQAEFLLDHRECTLENQATCNIPSDNLRRLVDDYSRPVDLWLINYEGQTNLRQQGCEYARTDRTDGYKAQYYKCRL